MKVYPTVLLQAMLVGKTKQSETSKMNENLF